VLDEPTAVLTPTQIERLFETLRTLVDRGLTVVIITHKLDEVTEITDRVTVLREGKRVDTVETAGVDESDLAYMMVGREVIHDIEATDAEVGDPVLTVSGARAENDRGVEVLSGVDLTVREGEVLGLAGVSGNGQRALSQCIVGTRDLTEGSVTLDGEAIDDVPTRRRIEAGLSVIPSDRHEEGCAPDLSILHNAIVKDYCSERFQRGPMGVGMDYDAAREHAESLVEEYDVRVPGVDVDAGNLSGGNLQKLILGRELEREPSVLVANQPTRGLDVGAIEEVRKQILEQRAAGTGVLLVSEKFDEIMELSDRIAVIYEGEIVHEVGAEEADRGDVGLYMSSGTAAETQAPAPSAGD
jgi:simple sugar transport system ATP-binding protein